MLAFLHTRWCHVRVIPHRFRIRGASTSRKRGEEILQTRLDGRWRERLPAIEPYLWLNLLAMEPEVLYDKKPKYRNAWTDARLSYISRVVLQTKGNDVTHPHAIMLQNHFSKFLKKMSHTVPHRYPAAVASFRMYSQLKNRHSGVYLKAEKAAKEKKAQALAFRKGMAVAVRKAARSCTPLPVVKSKGRQPMVTYLRDLLNHQKSSIGKRSLMEKLHPTLLRMMTLARSRQGTVLLSTIPETWRHEVDQVHSIANSCSPSGLSSQYLRYCNS